MIDNVRQAEYIKLKLIDDGVDGLIAVGENQKEVPFRIHRAYAIARLGNHLAVRGKHAHKKLEQVIVCLNGSFELLLDDGFHKTSVSMDDPAKAVYMGPRLWHVMKGFSKDCIIMVFASDLYKEDDYIRDYDAFKKYIKKYDLL